MPYHRVFISALGYNGKMAVAKLDQFSQHIMPLIRIGLRNTLHESKQVLLVGKPEEEKVRNREV